MSATRPRCTTEHSAAAAVDCLRNLRRKTATELSSLGELLSQLSRPEEAVAAHERASRLRPTARRLQLLGEAHAAAGALDRATQTLSLAIRLAPTASAPYATLGYAHGRRERFVESRAAFAGAVALAPADAASYYGLGLTLRYTGEAARSVGALRAALRAAPTHGAAHFELGISLQELGKFAAALQTYDALLARWPAHVGALANRGTVLRSLGRIDEARRAYVGALELAPAFPEVYNNLAVLETGTEAASPARALAILREGLRLDPANAQWHSNAAFELQRLRRFSEASAAFDTAAGLAPAAGYFFCTALNARKRIVDWRAHEALNARVAAMLRAAGGCDQRPGVGGWDPLYGLSYPFRASLFRAVAAEIAEAKEAEAVRVAAALPPSPRAAWHAVPPAGAPPFRLRVGFVSADLRQHVMAFLTRGLFEHIAGDAPTRGGRRRRRRALDVWAFSLNADDGSEWRRSIEESVADAARDEGGGGGDDDGGGGGGGEGGRFVDLSANLEADAAAARLRAAGLHALVDLNGFTTHERSELLALRPAPVAMHAVGFPGTMGARFVPYMLLDRAAAPPRAAAALTERLVLMPHCYQVNDHRSYAVEVREAAAAAAAAATAAAAAARRGGATLVNFNQLYKLTPTALRAWCGVLGAAPRASLWLLAQPADAAAHVWREAAACGLRRARVVIAPIEPRVAEHLARVGGAQLALDTPEYNCHTTGSDALFAGVPLLTLPGEQMASRVARSLVAATASLAPVRSLREYEAAAARLVAAPAPPQVYDTVSS